MIRTMVVILKHHTCTSVSNSESKYWHYLAKCEVIITIISYSQPPMSASNYTLHLSHWRELQAVLGIIIYWVCWVSLESTASLTSITSHCFGLFNVDFQAVKWSIFHLHQNLIILSWMPIFQHFYTSFQMISCWNLWSKS
mgnify:CR=1 FL=1